MIQSQARHVQGQLCNPNKPSSKCGLLGHLPLTNKRKINIAAARLNATASFDSSRITNCLKCCYATKVSNLDHSFIWNVVIQRLHIYICNSLWTFIQVLNKPQKSEYHESLFCINRRSTHSRVHIHKSKSRVQ
jgi:hypothetical protein